MYGCGDLITDYEGIRGDEEWRGEIGAMYFCEVPPGAVGIEQLRMIPTKMKQMRLGRACDDDSRWLMERLNRISKSFDTQFELCDDGSIAMRKEKT